MKNKIIYLIAITLTFVSFTSCDDYLDISPEGQQNSENFFNNPQDFQDALIGVYDLLSTTALNNILGEIASDNSLCGGENPTDVLDWQQIDDMIHTPDNGALRSVWQWMYAGISRANYIIEFQDKIDFDEKQKILAENLFLRSYYYFELVKFFGDVPMYTDGRISIVEAQSIDRTPKSEIYSQLESDLLSTIENLPWQQVQKGRATKGAAWSLLGKIYLYQNKYDEAADAFNKVISSGQYQLVSNYASIFLNNNENNVESVFEVQYSGSQEGAGFGCFQCLEGNFAVGFMGPRFRDGDYTPYASGFSFNVPIQELVDLYDEADTRKESTIFDIDAFVASRPDVTYNLGSEHTGYFNHKYIPRAGSTAAQGELNYEMNYRAIRYSDVLLMAAEANNRKASADDAKAQNYLNQVRARAFGNSSQASSSTGATLTQEIWDERNFELAMEGHRFFDLVRTGEASTKVSGFISGKHEVFPIPQTEIDISGLTQNAGY